MYEDEGWADAYLIYEEVYTMIFYYSIKQAIWKHVKIPVSIQLKVDPVQKAFACGYFCFTVLLICKLCMHTYMVYAAKICCRNGGKHENTNWTEYTFPAP